MVTSHIRQQIVDHLRNLPGEQVKSLVLDWLTDSDGNLETFDRLLADQAVAVDAMNAALTFGELDSNLHFQPLSETEMVQKSREALEDYQRTGKGISHQQVWEWAASLGTDDELPCPK